VLHLAGNADALPQTNLRATGLEITQGVQNPNNDVALIQDRRTFVRLFVKSDGAAVPGVTAALTRVDDQGAALDEALDPVNPAGKLLTIQTNPNRDNLDHSFLFE